MLPVLVPPVVTGLRWYLRHVPGTVGKAYLAEHPLDHALQSHPRTRVTHAGGGTVFTVCTTDVIQRFLYLFGAWEPHLSGWLKDRLRPGDVFVDVGANIGWFSVLASRLVGPAGKVVAVEASPEIYRTLLGHLRANRCDNVRAVNLAAYDSSGQLTLYLNSSANLGATSIVRPDEVESQCVTQARPLAQILNQDDCRRARLIKIDVEGAEAAAVRGLVPVLDRLRPEVELVIEVCPERLAVLGSSVDEILDPLLSRGFHLYRLPNDYAASSYPAAIRRPAAPVRWTAPVTELSDLVFSRIDAPRLAPSRRRGPGRR